jgi:CheY-like chemotaxis protein
MLNSAPVVLVVDDECFARLFAVQILLDAGFDVLDACNAAEAVRILRENPDVGILITDIGMPGELDGWGLVAEARRAQPELRIVVMSGMADPGKGVRPGIDSFVAKPFTAGAFFGALTGLAPIAAGRRVPDMAMPLRA